MTAAARSAAPGASLPRGNGVSSHYVPLFNVTFRHGYYNAAGGACRDFQVFPTPSCAQLMASLGMIFRDLGSGFSVQINQASIPAMIAYLAQNYSAASPGSGYWTRLSFALVSTNPGFVGITKLPITTNTLSQNLYAANLDAVANGTHLMLSGGATGPTLFPVTGAGLTVATPAGCVATLLDISGAPVPVASTTGNGATRFAMGSLPYGLYMVQFDGGGAAVPAPQQYLYTPRQPPSFGLIDLLLTQPIAGDGPSAAFPVASMPPPASGVSPPAPAVQAVDLTLAFEPRKTYWQYYICSHDKAAHFGAGLQITGKGTTFAKSTAQLPNGDSAVLFSAKQPLPLQQLSEYRFELSGQRKGAGGGRDDISVDPLPASPANPVWPGPTGEPLAGMSEIYVYV